MNHGKMFDYIMLKTSAASRYEMLAEEAVELAHAAQKIARVLRNEQPVDSSIDSNELKNNLIEEYADVQLALDMVFGPFTDISDPVLNKIDDICDQKLERWYNRLRERESDAEKID